MNKRQKGFSLIELLIVVAIILIIAAIAIPNLLRARIAANQSSAVASLRTLSTSASMFQTTYGDGYPPSLAILGPVVGGAPGCAAGTPAGLIDANLAGGQKSGYLYGWTPGTVAIAPVPPGCTAGFTDGFAAIADPASGNTGTMHYCVDTSNVILQAAAAFAPGLVNGAISCGAGTPVGN